jgi:hypothetical protein
MSDWVCSIGTRLHCPAPGFLDLDWFPEILPMPVRKYWDQVRLGKALDMVRLYHFIIISDSVGYVKLT